MEKTENELIAEFMEILFDESGQCTDPEHKYSWRPGVYEPLRVDHLQYDTNWSWLMPVVEKIERIKGVHLVISELGCDIYSFGKRVSDSREDTKLKTVYNAVVEFIHWYNSQKQ